MLWISKQQNSTPTIHTFPGNTKWKNDPRTVCVSGEGGRDPDPEASTKGSKNDRGYKKNVNIYEWKHIFVLMASGLHRFPPA